MLKRIVLISSLMSVAAIPAAADTVVLRLKGSDIEMSGTLRGFDGARYTLEVGSGGVISLDAASYDCIGAACGAFATAPLNAGGASTLVIDSAGSQPAKPVAIEGSPVIGLDLMPALIRAYAADRGEAVKQLLGANAREASFRVADGRGGGLGSVDLRRYGTDAGFKALANGSAAIALSSRPITPVERDALFAAQPQAKSSEHERVLGLDGLVAIVAPGNPASAIGIEMLARIFSGAVTDWSELGLPHGRINVYATAAGDTFSDIVLKPRGLTLAKSATRVLDEAELSDAVSNDPLAIGITSFAFQRNARGLDITTTCGVTVKPSTFAVKAEEYPLSRRLYVYTAGEPADPGAEQLVRFMVSRKAQAVIRDAAFIDQSIESVPFSDVEPRIAASLKGKSAMAIETLQTQQFIAEVNAARRLSVTFRFALNAADLDAKARGDLVRLAEHLKTPDMAGKSVMLVGFTDAIGPPWLNQALSKKRAEEVRDALLKADPSIASSVTLAAFGFGPAAPAVCNAGKRGDANRRVEVWVRDAGFVAAAPASPAAATALAPEARRADAPAPRPGRKKRRR